MTAERTNLGPLTTQFKYPDACTAPVISCSTCETAWQAQTCGDNGENSQGVSDNVDCWPPRESATERRPVNGGWGFYSPGLECPVGYRAACSATGPSTGDFNFQFAIEDDETVIGCCPTGYTCANPGEHQTCTTVAWRGELQALTCSTGQAIVSWINLPHTYTETGTASGDPSVLKSVTIFAPLFQLNHKASDLPSSSASVTSTVSSSAPAATTDPSDGSSGGGGLSTGAQAGIGVGVGVVGLAIIAAVALLLWRRRKSSVPSTPESPGQKSGAELAGSQSHPVELHGNHRAELA